MTKREKKQAVDPAKTFKAYRETFYRILNEKLRALPEHGAGAGDDPYLRPLRESIERQCSGSPLPAEELERHKADLFEQWVIERKIPHTGLVKLSQREADHHVRENLDPSWPDRSADFARRVDQENERRKDEEAARRAESSAMMPELIARAKALSQRFAKPGAAADAPSGEGPGGAAHISREKEDRRITVSLVKRLILVLIIFVLLEIMASLLAWRYGEGANFFLKWQNLWQYHVIAFAIPAFLSPFILGRENVRLLKWRRGEDVDLTR